MRTFYPFYYSLCTCFSLFIGFSECIEGLMCIVMCMCVCECVCCVCMLPCGSSSAGCPSCRGSRTEWQGCSERWHRNTTSWYAEDPRAWCPPSSQRWRSKMRAEKHTLDYSVCLYGTRHGTRGIKSNAWHVRNKLSLYAQWFTNDTLLDIKQNILLYDASPVESDT